MDPISARRASRQRRCASASANQALRIRQVRIFRVVPYVATFRRDRTMSINEALWRREVARLRHGTIVNVANVAVKNRQAIIMAARYGNFNNVNHQVA